MPTAVFRSRSTRPLASAGAALLMLGVISGCGGGSSKTTSGKTTSSTTTTTTTPAKPKPKPKLAETVKVNSSGAKFVSSVGAKDGDIVEFRTVVPGKRPGTVRLKVTQGNGRIAVTASANHQTSTATVSGRGLKLTLLHYSCDLPPAPSFCPASHISTSSPGYQLQFPAKQGAPIVLVGTVATKNPPAGKQKPTSGAVVAPYVVTQKVKAKAPSTSGSSAPSAKPSSAASVRAGGIVALNTYIGGKIAGAPQPVTVTIAQGPATSLTVTATAPGASASHATISGAGGSKIALISPRFSCFLPPDPTFCPATKVQVGHGRYTITFRVTPNKSPVAIVADVRAG